MENRKNVHLVWKFVITYFENFLTSQAAKILKFGSKWCKSFNNRIKNYLECRELYFLEHILNFSHLIISLKFQEFWFVLRARFDLILRFFLNVKVWSNACSKIAWRKVCSKYGKHALNSSSEPPNISQEVKYFSRVSFIDRLKLVELQNEFSENLSFNYIYTIIIIKCFTPSFDFGKLDFFKLLSFATPLFFVISKECFGNKLRDRGWKLYQIIVVISLQANIWPLKVDIIWLIMVILFPFWKPSRA